MVPERSLARGARAAAGFEIKRKKDHCGTPNAPELRFEADKAREARRWFSRSA
jgi:hypothetical protein